MSRGEDVHLDIQHECLLEGHVLDPINAPCYTCLVRKLEEYEAVTQIAREFQSRLSCGGIGHMYADFANALAKLDGKKT